MTGDLAREAQSAGVESEADGSAQHRFLRSTALVGALTLVSRLTGFVREVLVASAFGTTAAASALVLAQTVPNLSRSFASEEVAQGTLVPELTKMAADAREDDARSLAWMSGLVATGVLAGITVLVLLLSEQLASAISPGAHAAETSQTAELIRVLAPVIVFNGCLGASSAFLVAKGRFGVVGVGSVFSNIPVLAGLLLFPQMSVRSAALLLVAGYALQAIFLFVVAIQGRPPRKARRRTVEQAARLRADLVRVGLLAPPIVLSLCMANLSGIVDMAFSSLVSTGAPAALDKAFRLVMLPYGVFAVAIGVVALPSLARAARLGDFDGELVRTLRLQAVILVPIAVGAGVLADDLVRLAYQRGEFDAGSSALTADALVGVAFALPAMGLSLVGTRAWLSRQRPWRPAAVAIAGLVLNGLLDWLLIKPFGVMGVGISTAVVHALVGIYLALTAMSEPRRVARGLAAFGARLAVVVGLATLAGLSCSRILAFMPDAAGQGTGLLAASLVLLAVAPRLGVPDYRILVHALRSRRESTTRSVP